VPVPVQSREPFEVTCEKFNQFYAMPLLPNGRVRPIFPTFSPPNVPDVDYSFIAYGTPEIEGDLLGKFQILFLNQEMFEHYYEILQYFPCEEAINLGRQIKNYGDKYLKIKTSNFHEWKEMSAEVEDISCLKKSFVYFVFRYIVIPVVERWKSYTDEESEIDEDYLSALLQFELLNSMNKILLPGKRKVYTHDGLPKFREHKQYAPGMNAYSPQEQQVVDSLQQSLETAKQLLQQIEEQRQQQIEEQRRLQQEQEQQQIEEQRQQQIEKQRRLQQIEEQRRLQHPLTILTEQKRNTMIEEDENVFGLGGGSKHKRQRSKRQRSKRQRSKRQRSKRQRSKRQRSKRQRSKRQRREQSKRRRQRQKSKKNHK
jgi:hypothetical protein